MSTFIGEVLDRVCVQIMAERERGHDVRSLRASPDVYHAILGAHRREIERGNPLMVLDLELILDVVLDDQQAIVE